MEINRNRIFVILGEALIAALLAAGLTVIAAQSAGFSVQASVCYFSAGLCAVALFGLSYSRASGWITLLIMALAALISVCFGWRPIEDIKSFLDDVYMGQAVEAHLGALSVLCVILLITAFYIIAHQRVGAYLMLFVTVALLSILWFFGEISTSIHILPVICALSAMFSKTARFKFSALRPLLSLSLIAAIVSCMLVPSHGVKVDKLNEYAQKALAFMIRTFNIDNRNMEERRSFTIAADGWAGYKELIGGNAYPSEAEVMKVTGEAGDVYLRGALRYVYNNNAWVDESNESKAGKIKRYMFSGFEKLIYKSEYERAMDLDKRASDVYFGDASIGIEMLSDTGFWTLYTPGRVTDVDVDTDAFVYFNNVGEMFINRPMKSGDRFFIEYDRLKTDGEGISEMLRKLSKEKDDGYKNASVLNKDLPGNIDPYVYETTYRITQGAETPYDKAAAIENYLKANGTYSLESAYPPEGTDAVSFFMSEGMKGYCVHFASAMTVMCRIAGLPARYVEGYLCIIDESGECIVTGLDAHAWTEVYLNGFGWMTFDATPPDRDDDPQNENSNENGGDVPSDNGETGHDEDETGDDPMNSNTAPTPTPKPTPTPEPTNEPTQKPNDDSDPFAGQNDLFTDPTPTPTPAPNTGNNQPGGEGNRENEGNDTRDDSDLNDGNDSDSALNAILLILLILFVLLALFLCAYFRILATSPERMARRTRKSEDQLMCWYRAMLTALEMSRIRYEAGETCVMFAKRALERGACTEEFARFSKLVAMRRYSESESAKEDFRIADNAYRGIKHLMRLPSKIRWYARRIFSGIGRVNQVP